MQDEIIVACITGLVTVFNIIFTTVSGERRTRETEKKLEDSRQDSRIAILESGVQALLRGEIIRCHDKYMERGYCPVYAREALERAYKAYKDLGGNDVATGLYKQVMALPTEKGELKL